MTTQVRNAVFFITGTLGALILIAFFLTSFGRAEQDVKITNITVSEAQCQGRCQALLALGYNYNTCNELMNNTDAQYYINNCNQTCRVTIKDAIMCTLK